MKWSGQRILVTGGGGFLGGHLIRRLIELGVSDIKSIGRRPRPKLQTLGVAQIMGDIANPDVAMAACSERDIVFHTAAKAGVWGAFKDFHSANVAGTANIINACRTQNVPVLVNTSSPSVVFSRHDLENVDETHPCPSNYPAWYPATKAEAERLVTVAASEELRTISLRPHLIWGVGDNHILPRLADRAAAGRLRRVGNGTNKVDLTHVSNAVQAHVLAAEALMEEAALSGGIYFISDGSPVNLWEWIADFIKKMSLPEIPGSISFRQAYALGAAFECAYNAFGIKKEPPMTRFVAAELAHSHYFNISAARRDLGYAPSVDTDKALDEAVEWLKAKRNSATS
ncbi:MAG: NAD-dependent epimerase/dehydratase family protein [Victivallales bacterium]|nr:NAD-dependent epimerase/dehydratase family protein [Victivallales bacterium]